MIVSVTVGTDLEYAAAHEFGAVIRPRNARFLHFFVDGHEVFTKGPVEIPARPFLRPAADERGQAAAAVVGRVAGRLIEQAAAG